MVASIKKIVMTSMLQQISYICCFL